MIKANVTDPSWLKFATAKEFIVSDDFMDFFRNRVSFRLRSIFPNIFSQNGYSSHLDGIRKTIFWTQNWLTSI